MEENATLTVNISGNDNSTTSLAESAASGHDPFIMLNYGSLRYIIMVSYLTTFVLGLLGNSLVIYIIAHFGKIRMKSVANYYIWNLAFADILFILTMPLFCFATYTRNWPFGGAVCCKIAYVFREINKFASVFTLVALSADRYLATCPQLSYLRTIQVGKLVCCGIWLVCGAIATPYVMFANTVATPYGQSCRLVWPRDHLLSYMRFWTVFQLLVGLIGPFLLISTSYLLLCRRFGLFVTWQGQSDVRRPVRRMTQTVVVVVVVFLVCQTPYHAVQVVSLKIADAYHSNISVNGTLWSQPSQKDISTFVYMNALAQILVFVSSTCNPVVYALMNESFRKLYSIVLCRCQHGGSLMEDLRDLEVDGRYVPISLKIQVTFHLPCVGSWSNKANARSSVDDRTTDLQTLQTTSL